MSALGASIVLAQDLTPGGYYWYAPEHEKSGRTSFYTEPSFSSGTVRITRTQRFRYGPGRRGWVLLEFDIAGKAYIHLRVLRTLLHDPAASDPWYEFQRASVFAEEPGKMEARLKATVAPSATATDSKTPAWKRYKDGWSINKPTDRPGATELPSSDVSPETAAPATTPSAKPSATRPRSRYPLLPPIGSEPPPEAPAAESTDTDPNSAAANR
jgi:hypothetical protein